MAFTFPSSPATNDTYTVGSRTYTWTGFVWEMTGGLITTSQLTDLGVTTAKINDLAVTAGKIANATITATQIASNAVTTAKILDANVTADKIANATITATQIASDAVTQAKIADRAVGSAELDNLTLNSQTGTSYTLVLADAHKLVTLSNASAITLTIPTDSSVAFEIGDQVNIAQLGAGQVTVGGAGVTLRSQGSKLKLNGQYSAATLIKIDTNEWVLVGNTAA